jgi:transcription antitermination factor NusG
MSNCEKVASAVLEGKGYEQYLPLHRVRRRRSDRVVQTELPLFPGYVFCRFDATQRLPIMTTPGVVSILGFGKTPVPVPDSEIEAIQTIVRSGMAAEPCSFPQEGQEIRVHRGSLEGLEGILLKKKTEWRMVVSLTILQRSLSVEIDRDSITAM